MENQVIKVLTKEHGKKVMQFWKDRGIDTKGCVGSSNEEDGNTSIYYGVINGEFDNYSLRQVQRNNAEIMIFFPKEEVSTPTECSICDLAESEKILLLDKEGNIKHEHVLYDKSKVKEEPIFKVGDKVYHVIHGWGRVKTLDEVSFSVKFDDLIEDETWFLNGKPNLLSFTEYTIQGFSQERPIELPEVGELCLMRDEDEDRWRCMKFGGYDADFTYPFITDTGGAFKQMKRIKILD